MNLFRVVFLFRTIHLLNLASCDHQGRNAEKEVVRIIANSELMKSELVSFH
jgi:hypothetical protein